MVFVVINGLPLDVDPTDLAEKINIYFGENTEIGTFRINIDDSDIRKPKAVLKFKQGFHAMEAQRLLENFKYVDSDSMIHTIKAIVPSNHQPYQTLFCEEIPDIADVIKAEKSKLKKRKRAKKRKYSPVDKNLQPKDSDLSKTALEVVDIEKLKKKPDKHSSQSDRNASESECKKNRDKNIYGESSGVSKRPKSPEDVPKKKPKKEVSEQRIAESSKTLISSSNCKSREPSRSTTTKDSLSSSQRVPECPKGIFKNYKIPHRSDNSSNSFDSRKGNVCKKTNRKLSENQSFDEIIRQSNSEQNYPIPDKQDYSSLSTFEQSVEDPRNKMNAGRLMMEPKPREYASYYSYERGASSRECTDPEYTVAEERRGIKLLLVDPSHYLTENDLEFQEAVEHIIDTVMTNTERLQEDDKKLILENYTTTVVKRLKNLKFTNLMSIQDIVLDYKLSYKTSDDKLLINNLIKELQALGKGVLLPEIKQERLGEAIDEVLKTTDLDELMEVVKPDIKPDIKTEITLEYEDGETTEVINIVVNLVPIEKRELPFETDPEKVADIKVFVSKLKKTKPNKFFRPIRSLINEMKLFIYNNAKIVPSEVILNRMVEVLEKILARMLGPIKTRVKAKDVCNLFRNSFPYKEDREFVDMIIKWIVDGEFDKGIDSLIKKKLPNIEKNIKTIDEDNKSKIKQSLLDTIKIEPTDGSYRANPTLLPRIKIKNTHNRYMEQSKQRFTTYMYRTKERMTKDVKIKIEKHTDDDIVIKKEIFDVIEDDLVIKKELVDEYISPKVKLETINISDSEDEGAQSDDSRKTLVIENKPFIDNLGFGINDNINRDFPVPNKSLKSEPREILDEPIEILDEPRDILGEAGEILDEPGDIMGELGETIEDIRQFLKREKN